MNGLRKSFWVVHSSADQTSYDSEEVPGGFEAPSHFMAHDHYYINELSIEAHFGNDQALLKMSPFITVYESYGAAFNRARELHRKGAQEIKLAEIDGGDLKPDVLEIPFPNRMVTVPVLHSTQRQNFMNIQDLKGAFNLNIPVGHYHVWLVLDDITQDLITWITTKGVSEKIAEWRSKLGRELHTPIPAPPSVPTARGGYEPELRHGPAFEWIRVTPKPWQEPSMVYSSAEILAPRPRPYFPQSTQPSVNSFGSASNLGSHPSRPSQYFSLYAPPSPLQSGYAQQARSQLDEAGGSGSDTPPLTATPRPPPGSLPPPSGPAASESDL
ncbi:MAG: hypothetical protein Q9183_002080 [Haloplaca sp. 2 TL-2023]